ncbi:MAG: sigma 54-interacting transcriptional regulator [Deltaproteobacteria bacterium]|nr:sigma 54-interacting transcriptional regulator [Deltaproteobacteria bacterium]
MNGKALDSRYFPLILDVLEAGVFTVDPNGSITSFNRAAERITGYSAEAVIGSRCSEVFRTDLCDKVCPLSVSISLRRTARNHEVYIQGHDGRPIPISISTAPLETPDGRLLGGVEVFRDMSQIVDLKRRLEDRYRLADIIGKSPVMQRIFEMLPLVANSNSNILVSGPSGTGKELVARTIHALGPRKRKPFIAVNCAAIPDTLLESELFGYLKGAFTDARKDKPGRIAAAEGGTLFLDEVADLPGVTQVKVLRFLQDRLYEPLGSNRPVKADVRIISATNRELDEMVRRDGFREDLYYRLNVFQIDLPPLSQRKEDIPLLVNHYVKLFRHSTGKDISGVSDEAMAILMSHPFPGNVRELENVIERAFILCQDRQIEPEHLPPSVHRGPREPGNGTIRANTIDVAKVVSIRDALARHGGNRTHAARELGIHRTTLIRLMKKHGIT